MTFLGEWGDRSQIATIAMAAGNDYWWVTLGALLGHACCTGVAVIGGRAIAGKVSLRVGKYCASHTFNNLVTDFETVTLGGAVAFLVFGFIFLAEAMAHS
jgi:putative Ca2+/H+ antiporter (TMEM165/GDT1 family)